MFVLHSTRSGCLVIDSAAAILDRRRIVVSRLTHYSITDHLSLLIRVRG